jgi:hypothetical protein
MKTDRSVVPGSARGSRARFGGSPKQTSGRIESNGNARTEKSSRGWATLVRTRAACAPLIIAEPSVDI